ncbi:MAG: DUF4097 family beta strand repeat protein [Ruminococcus sp.]|nr:DUF4097 family beta strand repeat protein [Ruminococcus sp.]
MKNKGLLITVIVLLSVIVVLLLGFMVYSLAGNTLSFGIVPRAADRVIYDNSFEKVSDIDVDSDCGDVSFEENKDGKVHVIAYGESERDITVNFSDGKLTINYPQKQRFFNWSVVKNNIVISLPSDYENSIKVESDYGNVEICALPKASITADCDYGNIAVEEVKTADIINNCGNVNIGKAETAKVDVDYGRLEIGTVTHRCDLYNDCGDILVDALLITEDSTISDEYGKITVRNAPGICVDAKTDLGKLNINQNDPKADVTLTITNDCGDINVGK